MTKIRNIFLATAFLLALGGLQAATAATVTTSLGNASTVLVDDTTPPLTDPFAGSIAEAQGGQSAPFNQSIGADLGGLFGGVDFSASWTFNYVLPAFPEVITGATLEIGIFDVDSAAPGSQLASFIVDGVDLTAELDSLFEAGGGSADATYNVFSLALDPGLFANLSDGSAMVSLALAGPGLLPGLFGPGVSTNNGANLIYSTLSIDTALVPIPAAAPLFASALALMGLYRRRVLRNAA